jgi:uncharacterized protein YhdP
MKTQSTPAGSIRSITLRRDGKGALKFNGERIGSASRTNQIETDKGEDITLETSARLFKTSGGKYVVGIEEYDKTNEQYERRFAEAAASLQELVDALQPLRQRGVVDDDVLGELFEGTEVGEQFIEQID